MNSIYSDNLENFKSNSIHDENLNYTVISWNAINIFSYLVHNNKITQLTESELDSIQEDTSVDFAKVILENNLINIDEVFLKKCMNSDYSYIIEAAFELKYINFSDIENLISEAIDCNSLSILKLLIEKKYIPFNYDNDYILSSAFYNSNDETTDYILPLYKNTVATYDIIEAAIESGNEKYLSDCLNNVIFTEENIQKGFAQAINESQSEMIRLFNDFDNSLILLDNNFSNLLQVEDYELIFNIIDNQKINISVDYLDILVIAINNNIFIENVYFIDKILNHPKFDSYYLSSSNIIDAVNMFDTDNTNNSHDVFYKLFSIFKEDGNEITQVDNEILINAAKSECLEVFKAIYFEDQIQEELKESEEYITSLLYYAVRSENVLEFLLIEENINVNDNYEFVEQQHIYLTIDSLHILLKREDFIITEKLIINFCRHNQVKELTFFLQNEKFNTIENANNIFLETFKYCREEVLITLFEFDKIDLNNENKEFFLNSSVERGFVNIFKILIQLPIYINFSFNDIFYKSSKLLKCDILEILLNDKRVTDFNNPDESHNALFSSSYLNPHYRMRSIAFKETTLYALLNSDKIDTTINNSSFLFNLMKKDLIAEFQFAYNKEKRSDTINSSLFYKSLKNNDKNIYEFLYSNHKNNINISSSNYTILSELYLRGLYEEFSFFIKDTNLSKNTLDYLFEFIITNSSPYRTHYNINSFLKLIIDKEMFDNSTNEYLILKKSIKKINKSLFIEIFNKQEVPDIIIKDILINQLTFNNDNLSLFLINSFKDINNHCFLDYYKTFSKNFRFDNKPKEFDFNILNILVILEQSINDEKISNITINMKSLLFSQIINLDPDFINSPVLKTLINSFRVSEFVKEHSHESYKKYSTNYIHKNVLSF
jgi:hypothetical protein